MTRPIAFDLTRLFVGALGRTPRGIDRVDIGFARRLFDQPGPHVGLVPTPFRAGVVSGAAARAIAATVERRWREAGVSADPAPLAALQRWLADAGDGASPPPAPARHRDIPWPIGAMLARTGSAQIRPAVRAVPPGSLYVNVGQVLLGWPWCLGWLDRRPDVKAVFLLHDLIPLRFPEYSGPLLSRHHGRALATAARRATALLATSQASADDIRDGLKALGRGDMPIHVVPLPVSPSLLAPAGAARPAGPPYFVTLGILDQRKNHRLLLHVWRDMIRRSRGPVPNLVIIGAPGLRTAGLHDLIARSPGLSHAVRVVSDLPSPALRTVLGGARGLLMPSFTEGFGIPIIEARALGIPVVASDIPAHREVGGPDTVLLDPLDGPGWEHAIERLATASAGPPPAAGPPQDWDRYFAAVLPFLGSL